MNPNYERLPVGWEKVMAQAYEQGCSDIEVRAELRMTKGVWDSLYNDAVTTNFKQIVDFGRMLAQAWWMKQARTNLHERSFKDNLWYMVMKNQYGYSDKTTVDTKTSTDLTNEELNEQLRNFAEKFRKTVKA